MKIFLFSQNPKIPGCSHPTGLSWFRVCVAATAITLRLASFASAATRYVRAGSPSPGNGYTSWATAAHTIQDGVDAASAGDTVLVTNGTYDIGGAAAPGGALTNRVCITNAITVASVNGPAVTIIKGAWNPATTNGVGAVRCVYLGTNAVLSGFTLIRGATLTSASDMSDLNGGGVWCESGAVLTNCTLSGNSTADDGGGVEGGTLNRCTLMGNSADYGGGAYNATLNHCTLSTNSAYEGGGVEMCMLTNCTLTGNSASYAGGGANYYCTLDNCALIGNSAGDYGGGAELYCTLNNCTLTGNSAGVDAGGVDGCTLRNCIVYYNYAVSEPNYHGSPFYYSCTTPNPGGAGDITNNPDLASASHLALGSPCIGAGSSTYASGVDIDGEAWLNPPSMGCDEVVPGDITGPLTVSASANYTNVAVGFPVSFTANIAGKPTASVWNFQDGTTISNRPYATHAFAASGDYIVKLTAFSETYPSGVSATVEVHVARGIYYVNIANATPAAPYSTWATAATNIQDAVDAATLPGAVVLVTNGVYAAGGEVVPGGVLTNRVCVTNLITLASVNGPAVTTIKGAWDPVTTNGLAAVRCVYLGTDAMLSGFTLTGGATLASSTEESDINGGGVWCGSGAVVTNCTLSGNSAAANGGGADGGTLNDCTLTGNFASSTAYYSYGGGAVNSTLNDCTLSGNYAAWAGGGADGCTLNQCTLSDNSAYSRGGGAEGGTLNNCTLTGNSVGDYGDGGGADNSTLNNCALTGNSAGQNGGGTSYATLNNCTLMGNSATLAGGGAEGGTLDNCIVYYNHAPSAANYDGSTFNYSCTTPDPGGLGNITNNPDLASAWHLALGSPCIGAGSSAYSSGVDIDGEAWLNPPSMGCDEVVPGDIIGPLSVSASANYTNVAVGYPVSFTAHITGKPTASVWNFQDGTTISNRPYATHAFTSSGDYMVELTAFNETHPSGVSATVEVHVVQDVHYVNIGNATPAAPYSTWSTAATNIQVAVDAVTLPGALVLVTNGVYGAGGTVAPGGSLTNRVCVTNMIRLASVNGPAVTMIQGAWDPVTTNGPAAVRCVYLGANAILSGFTLTGGATLNSGAVNDTSGGGVWCASGAVLTNCTLAGNSAEYYGGGADGGTLNHCTLTGNSAYLTSYRGYGGGAANGWLNDCTLNGNYANDGGGAEGCTLNGCTLSGNYAYSSGGGADGGTLNYCTLTDNSANYEGGGADRVAALNDCTLTGNSAKTGGGGGASIADGGAMNDCTLTGNSAGGSGGGASIGNGATMNNCVLTDNSAAGDGGGAWGAGAPTPGFFSGSTLNNCAITGNSAGGNGGGVAEAGLNNCTLTGNSAFDGGGVYDSTLENCIAYYNHAASGANHDDSSFINYSCTMPAPSGENNLTNNPDLASAWHLALGSPCIGVGSSAYASGVDIDGEAWLYPPSVGCDEVVPGDITGPLSVSITANYTNVTVNFPVSFTANIAGKTTASVWNFQDGTTISNRPYATHVFASTGNYAVRLTAFNETYPSGVSATVVMHVGEKTIHYVNIANATPAAPYGTWATAATNIQDAVDAASAGDTVLVTNGAYTVGGEVMPGSTLTNRVCIDKALTVQSVNGPAVTSIQGAWNPITTNGPAAVRCVYLIANAMLSGFTLSNGATTANGEGGGVWCGTGAVVTNCWIMGNSAFNGGGAFRGALNDCTLARNSADGNSGGGAFQGTLDHCALTGNAADSGSGGGASSCTMTNCTLTGNFAGSGGGAAQGTLNYCILSNNIANSYGGYGGGANSCTLNHCTLTGNSAVDYGGGTEGGTLNDCALSGNHSDWNGGGADGGMLNNCTLVGNSARNEGGGAENATLNVCMLSGNSAYDGGGAAGYNSSLENCTLTGNQATTQGGGADGGTLIRCTLSGNSAGNATYAGGGGGAYGATLASCVLTGNSVTGSGGGADSATLNNCTLTGNSAAYYGGGAEGGTLNNCIVYFNHAVSGANYDGSTIHYSCTTPDPGGVGNITNNPDLASVSHLAVESPCIGAGSSTYASGVDIDGEAWLNPPSMGCNEVVPGDITGPLSVGIEANYTNVALGFPVSFKANITGKTTASVWNFPDGTIVSNRPYATHAFTASGNYIVKLTAFNETYPSGVSATVEVHVARGIYYVNIANATPAAPYSTWATAATNIQDAVDAATLPGAMVLVTNGVYATGEKVAPGGALTNRVCVTNVIRLASVNGPAVTTIQGAWNPATTNGPAAVRCVYLGTNAMLSGFTLTGGATLSASAGNGANDMSGGGVWCGSGAVLTNCMLSDNSAGYYGGGADGGTLNHCTLTGNSAEYGGGAGISTLNNCTLSGNSAFEGGGADSATLNHCTLTGNSAEYGGGTDGGILNQCRLTGNSATKSGGGAASGTLNNCLISRNLASGSSYAAGGADSCVLDNCTVVSNSTTGTSYCGGGTRSGTLTNCIVYFNTTPTNATYSGANYFGDTLSFSCTTPLPTSGLGNITNNPQFVDAASENFHLQPGSPCINAGNNGAIVGVSDLDGNPRIIGGVVDMGAYESTNGVTTNGVPWVWLLSYGLPTDGSAGRMDPDHDGVLTWQEYVADTNPTNAASYFHITAISNGPPVEVWFPSSANRLYTLESATNLVNAVWIPVPGKGPRAGVGGPDFLTDTNAGPQRFYRLMVQLP